VNHPGEVTSTATCMTFGGLDAGTGGELTATQTTTRVGWLADMVQVMGSAIIAAHWNQGDLGVLATKTDGAGVALPSNGWMALRRLAWDAPTPASVVVSDRVRRIAQEEAARALRLGVYRQEILAAIITTWPTSIDGSRTGADWADLNKALPARTQAAVVRNRIRQVKTFMADHDRRLPVGVCELEAPPLVARQVALAAADQQLVRVTRTSTSTAQVSVQLPTGPAPASFKDWTWVHLTVALPPTVPASATLCTPTLRPTDAGVRVDLPHRVTTAPAPLTGHARAVGVDWGLSTLLTASTAVLTPGGVVRTDGRPLRFEATGIAAKMVRLRTQREVLKTKADHLTRLLDGRGTGPLTQADDHARTKLAALTAEHAAVCARIYHLNQAIAWAAARWLTDQATGFGATVVYVEDLATMEAGGMGKAMNRRLSGAARGQLMTALAHTGAKAGIAVVTVPARGTSAGCPRCSAPVKHTKSPDQPVAGYHWAICACGLNLDRDHAASQRITGRGLASQASARRQRTGPAAVRAATDAAVLTRSRAKTGPTTRQVRPAAHNPLSPSRRQTPAPPTPGSRVDGQRPAGQQPQGSPQVLTTVLSCSAHRTHRVRAAVRGRGFHRNVRATPIRPRGLRRSNVPVKHPPAQKPSDNQRR